MSALLLLHGFTGHPDAWSPVLADSAARHVLVPALAGHAGALEPHAGPYSFTDEVDRLARLSQCASTGKRHVVGYSLGARLALGLALRHPELVRSLTLIGVNPGLESSRARAERAAADENWVRMLEERGVVAFAQAWSDQPLFVQERVLSAASRAAQHALRVRHDALALARSLRALGLAVMPNYWPELPKLTIPIELIVGSHDHKFLAIAQRMLGVCRSQLTVADGAGHNVLLEQPACIAHSLNRHRQETL